MNSLFFKSVLIQPPKIMGVQLRPFSAYHALVLMQFDNPFISREPVSNSDIAAALTIMSQGVNDKLSRFMALENSKIYRAYWLCKLFLSGDKKLELVIADIRAHIGGYTDLPEIRESWSGKSSGKGSGVPWPFRIAATVWKNFPCKENDAWDMPLNKAACFRACHAEDCGMQVADELGVEGMWKQWQSDPQSDKYATLEEYLKAQGRNN
jgi:hypothetical protein